MGQGTVSDRLHVLPQYVIPKHALTTFAGVIANGRAGRLTTYLIKWFVRRYGVNMDEAEYPDIGSYHTFNEFFTRALRPGARDIAQADYVCPVDGYLSQFGAIRYDQLTQAKGHEYSTVALVGGDRDLAAQFEHGSFATVYLSPKDYHRVHMPCDGRLRRMIFVPGALFSVSPATAGTVPNLFARNERVVCVFEAERGPFVVTLVGAAIVGSMATVWHGVVNPPGAREICEWNYEHQQLVFRKGDEMGRFLLGSTVVLLFSQATLRFNGEWTPLRSVRLGEAMANTIGCSPSRS